MEIGEIAGVGVLGVDLASSSVVKGVARGEKLEGLRLTSEPLSETDKAQKNDPEDSRSATETVKESPLEKPENADNNNATVKVADQTLRFEIKSELNPDTGVVEKKLVVSVLDGKTGDVIRTVPPEELKTQLSKASSLIGVMLDKAV